MRYSFTMRDVSAMLSIPSLGAFRTGEGDGRCVGDVQEMQQERGRCMSNSP